MWRKFSIKLLCVNEYRVNVGDYGTQYGVELEKFVFHCGEPEQ